MRPAIGAQAAENPLAFAARIQLESTLGVSHLEWRYDSDNIVENVARNFAVALLGNNGIGMLTATYVDGIGGRAAVPYRHPDQNLFRWSGHIGIERQDEIAVGLQHSSLQCTTLPGIFLGEDGYDAPIGEVNGMFAQQVLGVVTATIIHDDDFQARTPLANERLQPAKQQFHPIRLVVAGHHKGQVEWSRGMSIGMGGWQSSLVVFARKNNPVTQSLAS